MSRILVTGGAGFIGSHIASALLDDGARVRILDDLSTGNMHNVEAVREHGDVELIRGDVADEATVREAVDDCDFVFHEAALPSVPRSIADPVATNHACVTGTLNLLVAARDAGVKRLVYASSSSVYGDSELLPKEETMPTRPKSPYAVAKLAGENYVSIFGNVFEMETLSIRYFNVFGPRQDPMSPYAAVIPKFVDALLAGTAPTIHGDGEHSRDFTYIDNVVLANVKALAAPKLGGEVVNVAMGEKITLNELFANISELVGVSIEPIHGPELPGDVRHSRADITRARRLLGYEPVVPLNVGLRRTIEWMRMR